MAATYQDTAHAPSSPTDKNLCSYHRQVNTCTKQLTAPIAQPESGSGSSLLSPTKWPNLYNHWSGKDARAPYATFTMYSSPVSNALLPGSFDLHMQGLQASPASLKCLAIFSSKDMWKAHKQNRIKWSSTPKSSRMKMSMKEVLNSPLVF